MASELAKRNMERFNVTPYCANCDFWGMFSGLDLPARGYCRIHEFNTTGRMACDEWELD